MSINFALLTLFGDKNITVFQANLMEYHPQLGALYSHVLILHGETWYLAARCYNSAMVNTLLNEWKHAMSDSKL